MSRKNTVPLAERVARAADAALAARHFVSAVDILIRIGWLDPGAVERWRRGQIDCLEEVVQVNLPCISEAIQLFRSWATARGLLPSPTAYVGRTPDRPALRFSRGGNPALEASYRTHWVSPELSEKKRERLTETASRAPELVVIQPLNTEWVCHRCGGRGDPLTMENPGPACLRCVGLSNICRQAMLCSRDAPNRKAADMLSSCASAGLAAVTSDKVCWSSRRHWQMHSKNPEVRDSPGSSASKRLQPPVSFIAAVR